MSGDPFEVPSAPPGDTPTESVSLSAEWWPYVLGACETLRDSSQWDVSQEEWDSYFYYWVEELLERLAASS